jgi:3-methyladenine DNA glycosylase/8-oxoguanine DNA glycosylase
MPEAQASIATLDAPGIDPRLVLGPLAMLRSDPTTRLGHSEAIRVSWTPDGPASIAVRWGDEPGRVTVQCQGDGADWLKERSAGLIGADDDATSFSPEAGVVRRLWARFSGDRVGATRTVWHDLMWLAVQQRIRREDAAAQWRRLVMSMGEPSAHHEGLYAPPAPERLARAAPWSLRALGIDARRATTLIEAARVAHRLHRLSEVPFAEAVGPLQSIRGVGPWTTSCMSGLTWGASDTVITGDAGIPSLIAATLAGERRADDARMVELLEPFRPHRYRVLRLVLAARTSPRRL